MIIGYSVEGSTDRAFLKGLQERWCPAATLLEGHFRGSTGVALRREFKSVCIELREKGAEMFVFLTDANNRPWTEVYKEEDDKLPKEEKWRVIHGVADRNIEKWICSDAHWLARELGVEVTALQVDDPKSAFQAAMDITPQDRKEVEITAIVKRAPVRKWIEAGGSFKAFYTSSRDVGLSLGCSIQEET